MAKLKKLGLLFAGIFCMLAVIMFVFLPIIKNPAGVTTSVFDAFKGGDFIAMIFITILLLIAVGVLGFVGMNKNNAVLSFVSAGLALLTAIFCFCAKSFICSYLGMSDYASIMKLGVGGILAGIIALASTGAFVVSAIYALKNK